MIYNDMQLWCKFKKNLINKSEGNELKINIRKPSDYHPLISSYPLRRSTWLRVPSPETYYYMGYKITERNGIMSPNGLPKINKIKENIDSKTKKQK